MDAELQASADVLRDLVEIASPTGHGGGVRAVAERVAAELESTGADPRSRATTSSPSWTATASRCSCSATPTPSGRRDARSDAVPRRRHPGVRSRRLRRFRLVVEGRAAHAGTSPEERASAIEELAHQVLRIKGLGERAPGISVNVGVVHGGTEGNVVAAHAEARIDVRLAAGADARRLDDALGALRPVLDGTRLRLEEEYGRPPLERTERSVALFAKACEHGRELGLDLREATSGGGSDGNLVGALGVPVLDGLGAEGGGAHARGEHVRLGSIPLRARLLARLLEDPGL